MCPNTKNAASKLVALLFVAGPVLVALADEQPCGTVVNGGSVGTGYYSGSGASESDAIADLMGDMGISHPECAGCTPPETGCDPSTSVEYDDDTSGVEWGATDHDVQTGIWSVAAHVTSGFRWDQICTTCGVPPGQQ